MTLETVASCWRRFRSTPRHRDGRRASGDQRRGSGLPACQLGPAAPGSDARHQRSLLFVSRSVDCAGCGRRALPVCTAARRGDSSHLAAVQDLAGRGRPVYRGGLPRWIALLFQRARRTAALAGLSPLRGAQAAVRRCGRRAACAPRSRDGRARGAAAPPRAAHRRIRRGLRRQGRTRARRAPSVGAAAAARSRRAD